MDPIPEPIEVEHSGCGLYVHTPFCETKCGYCDFYSVAVKTRDTLPLVERVVAELRHRLARCSQKIRTVFCGGGTPTILPKEQLEFLIRAVTTAVGDSPIEEFTVEANPATVDDEKARLLVDSGVHRVSMGAQSFFPEELATLERLHRPEDIPPSVAVLRRHGVRQINLDLIFGIPGQTLDTWSQSLRRAIDLQPDHLACYGLTYEPATRLTAMRNARRLKPCPENLEADMYLCTIETLANAGYEQYETSNFAKPECRCRHNLLYWKNQPYLGVGPSAAGCIDGRRYKNIADIHGYVRLMDEQGHAEAESEILDTFALMLEMVMMQLRLVEGLSVASFRQRTGVDPREHFVSALAHLTELGLVTVSDTHIALTGQGRLVGDAVIRELACACHHAPVPSTQDGRS